MRSIVEVKNLRKSYGQVLAVDDVSFSIEEGICFGLLGPNGAGKTTTIEMMEGILRPDEGAVHFRGVPIDSKFKEKVGIQFQSTALPEFITVRETLELFASFYPNPRTLDEVIDLCSLGDLIKRDNRKLSGGQRQRLLLGIAIIPRPELVFLDEPTTGLDPQARRNFWDLIAKIKAENTTVVLTTHYMEEAESLCDRVAIMDHGKILENDTPAKLIGEHFSGALVRVPQVDGNLDRLPAGAEVGKSGLEIISSNLDSTMKELLEARVNLDGLSIHKPDLEDLFIKLTGSSLRS
ncbi:MAG TPA: ABC transporter ATP-binding protein [Spirochaetia bacterium]|nr:ABC transporter ATP-binding protein [Spirochaetia bacterium]